MTETDFRVQKGIVVGDGDVTVPSAHSVFAGTFDTNVTAAGVTLSGITLAADGTDTNIDINITPKGTGEVNITKVDINGGTIDGISSLTSSGDLDIGAHDLRAATLTADGLTAGRVVFAGTNGVLSDDSDLSFSGDTLTATKIGAFTAAGAIDFNNEDMTNVDIDSGAIDGTTIGGASAAAGTFTDMTATNALAGTFDTNVAAAGVTLSGTTLAADGTDTNIDINVNAKGTGSLVVGKVSIGGGAIDSTIIGGSTPAAGTFTGLTATSLNLSEGNLTNAGEISADKIKPDGATLGLEIDFSTANSARSKIIMPDNVANGLEIREGFTPYLRFKTTDSEEEIAAMRNFVIGLNGNGSSGHTLAFRGKTSGGDVRDIAFQASINAISSNNTGTQTYTLPTDFPAASGYVLSSTDAGVMSWAAQSSGTITALNNQGANRLVTIGSTTTELDGEATATYDGQTLHINTTTDNAPAQLLLEHSFNDTSGPNISLRLDKGAAGAASDIVGTIKFQGDDAGQNTTTYAGLKADVVAATSGSEEGRLSLQVAQTSNGDVADVLVLTGGDNADGSTSKVVVKGDLQVDGSTTTINSTTLDVDDLNITVAKGAADSAAADGAGLTVDGAGATFTYTDLGTRWNMNKSLSVTGRVAATTSFVIGSADLNETDLEKLDGITDGTIAANKAVVVDANKDASAFRNLSAASMSTGELRIDSGAVLLDSSSAASQSWTGGSAYVIADFDYSNFRTVKFVGQVSDGTDIDAFEVLVTWKGASAPADDAAIFMTTYAYMASSGTPLGSVTAVKDGTGGTVDVKFTPGSNGTYKYAVSAMQITAQ